MKRIGAIIALAALVQMTGCSPEVEQIVLDKESIVLQVGETAEITAIVLPDDAKETTLNWISSNESIFTVSDGTIEAIAEGSGTILVTSENGKSSMCNVVVESPGPDFMGMILKYEDNIWFSYGNDQSYIQVDTNPNDVDDSTAYLAESCLAIQDINDALGIPESLYTRLTSARAIDGTQTETYDEIRVTWSYHPDKGLKVTYEKLD